MKYRICENRNGKFKIQKKSWYLKLLLFPKFYWEDVKRSVKRRIKIADIDDEYTTMESIFDTFIEAENYLIGLTSKGKKEDDLNEVNYNEYWTCRKEY